MMNSHAGRSLLRLEPKRSVVIDIRHNIALPLAVWTWDVWALVLWFLFTHKLLRVCFPRRRMTEAYIGAFTWDVKLLWTDF